jgi:hypothetical protein
MTAIEYAAKREASLSRIYAAIEGEAQATALRIIQRDHAAVKREARRYLRSPSRFAFEFNRYFRPLPELLEAIESRIEFRSSFERTNPITLRAARLYCRIELRREREEARREKEAA